MGSLSLLLLAASAACGTEPNASRSLLAWHAFAEERGLGLASVTTDDADVGDVAVMEDRGDLVIRRNPFDLDGAGLRFAPNSNGGFDVVRLALPLELEGETLSLAADGARELLLPFEFPFFGLGYSRVFVHADGFVSLGAPDTGNADRGPGRLLEGPPRVAAFLADLDPERGGRVAARLLVDRVVIAWADVPGAAQANRNSFSITLRPDGSLDLVFGRLETREATVGLSPGGDALLLAADFSAAEPRGAPRGAMIEGFAERERLDLVAVVRRFLRSHPDAFEQLVVYTTRPLNPQPGSLAFAVGVRNEVRGIGLPINDDSAAWGSAGALASVVYMDAVVAYREVDGFEILGHETGHRWLAQLRFRSAGSEPNASLLGRGDTHWSFFFDSDASVLEGNRIEDQGGGRFATTDIVRGFSALDQYAMGLRAADDVPPFFYVALADDFRPQRTYKASSGPEVGVSFSGVRRDVTIADVIAAMGPRVPDAGHAPHLLRQAYLLVADAEAPATPDRLATLQGIRSRFPAWYAAATDGLGAVETSLR